MTGPVLIANRGEIACRVIRAARALGLETVAVYSDADADLPHVAQADRAVRLGPAPARDSYLNVARLLEVASETGASLVHPGYGFLAESAEFARAVAAQGLTFVGPDPEHIRLMGDKRNARAAAQTAGVPVLPGTDRLAADADLAAQAARIGLPLLVKAIAGGGGHGMARVDEVEKLPDAVARMRAFAARAFHDDGVYLERFLPAARHVEIQVFGFGDGRAVHLFDRDCSLQRRHQKVIEEAPAPGLPDSVRREMQEVSVRLAGQMGYAGAGTIEYLYDPAGQAFFFLEMNTRIQVEHPVTEMVTGQDLVALQLRQAMGERAELPQSDIRRDGAAVEARLYAENPARQFLPSPGRLGRLDLPRMEGVRVETGYATGTEITVHYDPMIAKIVAHGPDRETALDRLAEALRRTKVEGPATNREFLIEMIGVAEFRAARHDTRSVDRWAAAQRSASERKASQATES